MMMARRLASRQPGIAYGCDRREEAGGERVYSGSGGGADRECDDESREVARSNEDR